MGPELSTPHIVPLTTWVDQGSCAHHPTPHLWDDSAAEPAEQHQARQLCWGCPVLQECFDYALAHETPHDGQGTGIWAGLTYPERAAVLNYRGKRTLAS